MGPGPAAWRRLGRAISGTVDRTPGGLAAASIDASGLDGHPSAVVRPADAADLATLVRWARRYRVPLVARGGSTSLDGEATAPAGSAVVDLAPWDEILEIDPDDGIARVQPGVPNRTLDSALAPLGWTFPPNPGSGRISTIGGNAATNASGPRSYRHGSMRSWVRSVDVVDGRGRRWTAGGRYAKASIGPDLVGLLVGSEGTLGIFTSLTVRISPRPARRTGLVVPIPEGASLARTVGDVAQAMGAQGAALEFVDGATAEALRPFAGRDWPAGRGLLLAETEGTERSEEAALARLDAWAQRTTEPPEISVYPEADRLWEIRGKAGPALQGSGPALREDVVVPMGGLDAMLRAIEAIARREGVPVRVFGHIGQGNLHPNFVLDPRTSAAARIRSELGRTALRLGGAISGEHGIGSAKRAMLPSQLGAPGLELLTAMKRLLDPDGILNPGKLFPARPAARRGAGPRPSGSPSVAAVPRTRRA